MDAARLKNFQTFKGCSRNSTRARASLILALALASCQQAEANRRQLVVTGGERFVCTPVKVWDGDGPIHCAEGPKVRLAGIAAREIDGTCRTNQPCPEASAEAARDYLAGLLGEVVGRTTEGHVAVQGAALSCISNGSAGGKRTAAWCVSPVHGDLNCRMVESGLALKWPKYWNRHSC